MATIALNYSPIGQMSGFFEQIKTSISNYQSEILTIQNMSSAVDSTIYNLDDVISEVQTSTTLQDDKTAYIGTLDTQMQTFVDNAVSRDQQAAEEINASKDDFYERYEYLTPDIEQSGWENFWEDVGEWCKEHWVEIAITVVIIIGAVLAIAAVIASGGTALVPLLTALGFSSSMATVISLSIAVIAIVSTIGSSILNIVDLWANIDNPTFNAWQTGFNIVSSVSNIAYSIGSLYNVLKIKTSVPSSGNMGNTNMTLDDALVALDKSGVRPGQTVISRSRVMQIVNEYSPLKAQSSVYTDATTGVRYIVEGHHTTVAAKILGRASELNMNNYSPMPPSAMNIYWTKKWYEFWKIAIKVIE